MNKHIKIILFVLFQKVKRKILYKPTTIKGGKEELVTFRDQPETIYKGYAKRFGKNKGEKVLFPDYKTERLPR